MVANLISSGVSKPFDVMRILHQKNISNVSIRQLRSLINKIKDTNKIGSLNYGDLTEEIQKKLRSCQQYQTILIRRSYAHQSIGLIKNLGFVLQQKSYY